MKKFGKKSFGFGKKSFGSDTEIGPWFRFPIPKPSFGRTLMCTVMPAGICIWQLPEGELAKTVSVAMKRKIDFFTIFHVFFFLSGNGIYSSIRNQGSWKPKELKLRRG